MKKIIISICLIIIFFLIFFSYNTYENFNFSVQKTKYIPQYVGPILFYDYNDNIIGTYPDDKIWPNFFEKKNNKYINLIGAGKPFDIKFPKAKKGSIGVKGYKGLDGDIGPSGIKGLPITGEKGDKGDKGDRGDRGETGGCDICDKGDRGDKGNKGEKGDKGDQGDRGDRPLKKEAEIGIKGETGDMGPTGTLKGNTGNLGQKGPKGDKGLPGNVQAIKGEPGHLNPIINDDYLQINRQDNTNSPREITIGNNISTINIDSNSPYINKNFCIEKNGIERCINKDDIIRLYEFNNPICTCPNGIIADRDKCTFNGVACKQCSPGYYKKKTTINARWRKNIESTICEACDSSKCGSNKYLINCSNDNPGNCETCQGCPAGERRINCGAKNPGTCAQNVCKCTVDDDITVGNAASGANCTTNGGNICHTCYNGYYKQGNICRQCQDCPSGQYRKDCGGTSGGTCQGCQGCPAGKRRINCGGKNPGTCAQNVCKCTRDGITVGNAASGAACTSNGANKCISCYGGYYRSANNCYKKRSCPSNHLGANGVRSEGNDTTDRTCKSWSETGWYGPYFDYNSKSDGHYKRAYIVSWDGSNLWSYVLWNAQVYWYKWLANKNSTTQTETSWMPWPGGATERETKFQVGSKKYGGDDFRCEKHSRAPNYPNSNFDNRNPVVNNNGVCNGSWSSNQTNYYSIKYKDRFWS